jgi:hypothetical protein
MRKIGINDLSEIEHQGYDKKRLEAQLVGTLPPVTKICKITGKPYQTFPRDPNHSRWKKKETRNKKQSFDDLKKAA